MKRENFYTNNNVFPFVNIHLGQHQFFLELVWSLRGKLWLMSIMRVQPSSDASLRAISDSDAVEAADIFSAVYNSKGSVMRKLVKSQQLVKPPVKLPLASLPE